MIILIDNYDSFVHNLARYVGELGHDRRVIRNDAASIDAVMALAPQAVILSPGPCTPAEAGISVPLVRTLAPYVPILGVCLGHQCIAQAYGGTVVRSGSPAHGKASPVEHDGSTPFEDMPQPLMAGRYHSLVVEEVPDSLTVTARLADGTIMGLRHRDHPVIGLQFHPESVLTHDGHRLIENFLTFASAWHRPRIAAQ